MRRFKIKLLERALTLLPTTKVQSDQQRRTDRPSPYMVEDS